MRVKVKKGSLRFYVEFDSPSREDFEELNILGSEKREIAEKIYVERMLLEIGDCLDRIYRDYKYKIEQR